MSWKYVYFFNCKIPNTFSKNKNFQRVNKKYLSIKVLIKTQQINESISVSTIRLINNNPPPFIKY